MVFAFEGVEKSLEVTFTVPRRCEHAHAVDAPDQDHAHIRACRVCASAGARAITRQQWDELLELAACTIIGSSSTEAFDAYVLSESSLFVYADQIIAKTCGTTKLLNMLPRLLALAQTELQLEPSLLVYRRKNFGFPTQQPYPHTDYATEEQFLNDMFHGTSFVFDSPGGDSWFMYVADRTRRPSEAAAQPALPLPLPLPASCLHAAPHGHAVLELMMQDLDPETMARFYRLPEYRCDADMTEATGIADLLAGTHIDAHMFTPCGYSCNALAGEHYWTIHVTPEPHCSYVSFETNRVPADWPRLVQRVCHVFRPGRCVVTLRAASDALPSEAVHALEVPTPMRVQRDAVHHRAFVHSAVGVCFFRRVTGAGAYSTDEELAAVAALAAVDVDADAEAVAMAARRDEPDTLASLTPVKASRDVVKRARRKRGKRRGRTTPPRIEVGVC